MFIVQRGNNFFEWRFFEGIPEQTLTNLRGVSVAPSLLLQKIAHFHITVGHTAQNHLVPVGVISIDREWEQKHTSVLLIRYTVENTPYAYAPATTPLYPNRHFTPDLGFGHDTTDELRHGGIGEHLNCHIDIGNRQGRKFQTLG